MKSCNAILRFEEDKFVSCDLEENHEGYHRALMHEWEGEGVTQSDFATWARGLNLMKMKFPMTRKGIK